MVFVPSLQPDWWRGAIIYQVYPRSFLDTNGDGVGDLAGITARLEYIASLGVDAVWISPFLASPMKDFGYDVSDYRRVDPLFGDNGDFDELLAKAHSLGLAVLMDQVLSHTSDQHPWFQDSRRSRDSDKADWYVWADPRPDGTPPNNWLSLFGGSAWQWEPQRRQYYLHNFLASQPDLNFHNPEVRAQLLDDVRFWLDKGVDGFRLDTVNFYTHDPLLRDNPPMEERGERADGVPWSNPYAYQRHLYDKTQPENLDFIRELRALLDQYPGRTTIGEIGADDSLAVMAEYTQGGDKLHMAYTFDLMNERFSAAHVREVIERSVRALGDGWPCWSVGNHDIKRVLSRWGGDDPPASLAKVVLAMLTSLRGSVCIYQGEELGLLEAEVPRERLRDPYGIEFWPVFKGRDGCRTPMPWTPEPPHGGFSPCEPWLPVPDHHRERAVSVQESDVDSVLHAYRSFLRFRAGLPALRTGDIHFLDTPEPVLAFIKENGEERVLAVFNLGAEPASTTLPRPVLEQIGAALDDHGIARGQVRGEMLDLPGHGVYFASLGSDRDGDGGSDSPT